MLGQATWGEIKADYDRAKGNPFGGFFGGIKSYASRDYIRGLPEGAKSLAWDAPKAAIMSIVQPVRKDIFETVPMMKESISAFKIEIFKDLFKPISFVMGHTRAKIFDNLTDLSPIGLAKAAWGVATLPFAAFAGLGATLTHLPGDIMSLPAALVSGTAMTVGTVGRQFFGGLHTFGKGAGVFSDVVERGFNKALVSPGWAESRDSEYDNIVRNGAEFGIG